MQELNKNASIGLKEIKSVKFSLTEYGINSKKALSPDKFEYQFKLDSSVDAKEKSLKLILSTNLYEKVDDTVKYEIGELVTNFTFLIQNYDEIMLKDAEGTITVPDQIVLFTAGIALSTVRGILITKLENSPYANMLIPLIDIRSFISPKN